ncbi:RNA-directed DNA polymerase, eukaryota [Tanacetum coccineum]
MFSTSNYDSNITVMESFHLAFSRATDAGVFNGIRIGSSLMISHLFYADDAVFIGEWSQDNLIGIMHILRCFSLLSGLSINIKKSHLLGIGVPSSRVKPAAESLGCSVMSTPFNYLGIKVGGNMSMVNSWGDTVDKLKKRLSKWKLKSLSIGGRLTLLKSVLGSTPIYYMSLFKVPKAVLNQLEGMRRNFFNGIQDGERKIAWVKWSKVLASKKHGGLGVSSFYALNRALLTKWIWRFISKDNSLWGRVISTIHGPYSQKLTASHPSLWNSIIKEIQVIKLQGIDIISHCKIRIGNGMHTQFWNDFWIGDSVLKDMFPRLYSLENCKDCYVADKILSSVTTSFRRPVRGGHEAQQLSCLLEILEPVILSNMEDRWVWDMNGDGVFRVKDVRNLLDDTLLPKDEFPTRWVKCVPIKINVFAWKIFLDRLPTRLNLYRRGVVITSVECPNCGEANEDTTHIFFNCGLALDVMHLVCRWWNLDRSSFSSYSDWLVWFKALRMGSKKKDVLEGVFYVAWRGISKFYDGKWKSYGSLADAVKVSSVQDIVKKEDAYNGKRKNRIAHIVLLEELRNSSSERDEKVVSDVSSAKALPPCNCDAKSGSSKHTQLIRLMQFLMELNDVYQPIRSTILAKDPLPNVKDAFYVVSREESLRGLHLGSSSSSKSGNNNNKRFNANSDGNHSVPGTSGSISSSFANEQIMKLLSLINEKPTPATNMSSIDYSHSNNNVTFKLLNFYNNNVFFNLNFKSLRLTSGIVLFDVLVVREYNVSLLSVYKMIKDSKFIAGFDEHKCYIQDMNLGKLVGTGSETGGLYLFNLDKISKFAECNCGFMCYVSIKFGKSPSEFDHPIENPSEINLLEINFGKSLDDDISDDEDPLPHDLADSDVEDLINDDDGVEKMADVARALMAGTWWRGISKFYDGKSKSYRSLADAVKVSSIQDIVMKEDAYNGKRKNRIAHIVLLEELRNSSSERDEKFVFVLSVYFLFDLVVFCLPYVLICFSCVYLLLVIMEIGDAFGSNVDLINNLDAGNPLYLQNNDNSSLAIVNVKLVELYVGQIYSEVAFEVWTELKETYDKMDEFVVFNLMHKINNLKQGDLSIPDYYHKLNSVWREFHILTILPACVCEGRPPCNCDAKSGSSKHTQLIRLMQFLMELNDVYQPIRSTILAKDPLPNVKDAFYVVSREESLRGLHPGSSSSSKVQLATFIAKTNNNTNNFNRRVNGNTNNNNVNRGPNPDLLYKNCGLIGHTIEMFNANSDGNHFVPGTSGSISSSFANEHIMKLLSLINEKPTPATNMSSFSVLRLNLMCIMLLWVGLLTRGANQHMTDSTKNIFNVVDVSSLMLTVGHPNGTLAKIYAIGSLRLTSGIVLFDVLVVPEYNVSLLSVYKMIKDSKFFAGFDEHKCYIQDLNLGKLVGTGSETGGLYLFDLDKISKFAECNCGFMCYVSCELWHYRLGY